jgi:SAM-dependent methyltransferase
VRGGKQSFAAAQGCNLEKRRNENWVLEEEDKLMDPMELAYQEAKKKDPTASYARVSGNVIYDTLVNNGAAHATLGIKLEQDGQWETAGLQTFKSMFRFGRITPNYRVVEYGCGSLRVGYHFIKYLSAGHFTGLDVIDGFFKIGLEKIGPEILADKQPVVSVIGPESVKAASEFRADLVYLSGVAIHVHDDDVSEFFSNLRQIVNKRGATLVMSAHIAESTFQHRPTCWARPIDFFEQQLDGLRLVKFQPSATRPSPYGDYQVGYLVFTRD